MVSKRGTQLGQGMTEYVLMLALLTALGLYLTRKMIGNPTQATGGAVGSMTVNVSKKIANDQ